MNQFSTRDFSFDSQRNTFSEEISTLSQGGTKPVFGQIYDDACDEGFSLISHVTGVEIVFYVDKVDYQGPVIDNEIAGWYLRPTTESVRKHPGCKDVKVLVIND